MSKEGFLRRWARLKATPESAAAQGGRDTALCAPGAARADGADLALEFPPVAETEPHPPVAPTPVAEPQPRRVPTLDDVAMLGPDSDFSAFMKQGVDKAVQLQAMKKLFADPHFSVMDGLDIYIDDYNKAELVPAAMLASLEHAKGIFARFTDDANEGQDAPGAPPKGQQDGTEPPQQNDA